MPLGIGVVIMDLNWEALVDIATEGLVCDRCLGRAFGKIGKDMDNLSRGAILRGVALGGDVVADPELLQVIFSSEKPEGKPLESHPNCPVCEGIFQDIQGLAELVMNAFDGFECNNFQLGSKMDTQVISAEEGLWNKLGTENGESIKSEMNRVVGKRVEETLKVPAEFSRPDIVAILDTRFNTVKLQISPVFFYGRYRKLKRGIPQTRWHCRSCRGRGCDRCDGTGKMYQTSVEELITEPVLKEFVGKEAFLHGMGREDIDARMLGDGRPFAMEVREPRRRQLDWEKLERDINTNGGGDVEVQDIRGSSREEMVELKASRSEKTYLARIEFEEDVDLEKVKSVISSFGGTQITQRTPKRVAHRRSDLERSRRVELMELVEADGRRASVKVRGEAGLYIKELIHGDGGRTQPSLTGALGVPCTVIELDVLQVHAEPHNTQRESDGQKI